MILKEIIYTKLHGYYSTFLASHTYTFRNPVQHNVVVKIEFSSPVLPPQKHMEETEKKKDDKVYEEEVHNSWCSVKLQLLFGFGAGLVFIFYPSGLL
jgi:hypothetical protein